METILNLVWVGVALVSIALWFLRWSLCTRKPAARIRAEIIAMGCAILLLFPVISLTDDLHPEILAVDAVSGKRNGVSLIAHTARPHEAAPKAGIHSLNGVIPSLTGTPVFLVVRMCALFHSSVDLWRSTCHLGRSPPLLP
jgi:hypothetical protein